MPNGFKRYWLKGYAILPCFTVKTLEGSPESEMTCGPVLFTIFRLFFAPFWTGRIRVTGRYTEEF